MLLVPNIFLFPFFLLLSFDLLRQYFRHSDYNTWSDRFGWLLCQTNHCRLFNAKSSLSIYIEYIEFSLVWFYGISTIVGHLMQNPLYTYILNIYDLVWLGFMAYQPL